MRTHIAFLLDQTGSMNSIKDDTIGGFNAFLAAQIAAAESPDVVITMTLALFDSNKTEIRCDRVPVKHVPKLNNGNYIPGASTPLIDASYILIQNTIESQNEMMSDRVIIVIQTDGQENASTTYKKEQLDALVKQQTEAGWEFTFLGAGIDAFATAMSAGLGGIGQARTLSYDRGSSQVTLDSLASNAAAYASGTRADMTYTSAQRVASGDTFHNEVGGDDPGSTITLENIQQSLEEAKNKGR